MVLLGYVRVVSWHSSLNSHMAIDQNEVSPFTRVSLYQTGELDSGAYPARDAPALRGRPFDRCRPLPPTDKDLRPSAGSGENDSIRHAHRTVAVITKRQEEDIRCCMFSPF